MRTIYFIIFALSLLSFNVAYAAKWNYIFNETDFESGSAGSLDDIHGSVNFLTIKYPNRHGKISSLFSISYYADETGDYDDIGVCDHYSFCTAVFNIGGQKIYDIGVQSTQKKSSVYMLISSTTNADKIFNALTKHKKFSVRISNEIDGYYDTLYFESDDLLQSKKVFYK